MGEDKTFYTCNAPLKKDEVRTLHVNQPGDECDHTNFGADSGKNAPDFNVLELYKQAHPHVVKIDLTYEDSKTHKQLFSTGSGFIVDGKDGHKRIVTADHVVHPTNGKALNISIATDRREGFNARIERFDPKTDLAVLTIDRKLERHLPPSIKLAKEADLQGKSLAVGHARGAEDQFVSPGRNNGTSTINSIRAETGNGIDGSRMRRNEPMIASIAHVEPGQSGGPLLNPKGEAQGVILASNGSDRAYSIPIYKVIPLLEMKDKPQVIMKADGHIPLPPHRPASPGQVPLPHRRPSDS